MEESEWGEGNDVDIPPILQGRMDLVLRSPDGQVAIIDYKNTSFAVPKGDLTLKKQETNPDGSPKELDDCQMAAYVFLWEKNKPEPKDKVSRASFVTIKNYKESQVIYEDATARSGAVPREDFEPAIESLKRRILFMKESLDKKTFSLSEVKRHKDCAACDYKALCRTSY